MCMIAKYSICQFKEEMHIHACKTLANLIQKICVPKNNLRNETMKTYILASIFTDKESLELFENNNGDKESGWIAGIPEVKYRENGTKKERISDADSRWDNFPETIHGLIYENGHRYYQNIEKGDRAYKIKDKYFVSKIQVLLAENSICALPEVPGLVVLETSGDEKSDIGQDDIYQYLIVNSIIPGFNLDEAKIIESKECKCLGKKMQKVMWRKNIRPFIYKVNVVNSIDSFDSNVLKNFYDFKEGDSIKIDFISKLHLLASGDNPSLNAREKWKKEKPKGLHISKYGDWCFYVRSKGVVYYIYDHDRDSRNLAINFQGYAESFHLDAIMLSVLKNTLVNYYANQIQEYIAEDNKRAIKYINDIINRMYIMYDMGRTNPRGGEHVIVMEKVESALHFQQNLNVLMDSVQKIEGINSVQRQENLARYALLVAIIMVVPAVVALLNDGTVNYGTYKFYSFILYIGLLLFLAAIMAGLSRISHQGWVRKFLSFVFAEQQEGRKK